MGANGLDAVLDAVIEISDLGVSFEGRRVLDGLSLSVRRGEIFAFLGPNGAGKSTTIKALLGLVRPDKGRVRLGGFEPSDPRARASVGYLPEEAAYYRFLNPFELLSFYGEIFRLPKTPLKSRMEKLLLLVGLSEFAKRPIRTFSKGMMQKLGLAQALINDPEILILDEPTSGLDPIARLALRKILTDLKAAGKTIFFSSHELSEAELLCDSLAIIKSGRIVKSGPLHEVLEGDKEQNLERFFLRTVK